jgi:uncharacterized protein (TIGR04255 family)
MPVMPITPDAPTTTLPSFRAPPVVEVVLGMQFTAPQLGVVHVGAFYQRIRHRYPKVVQVPPLAASFETFASTLPPVGSPPPVLPAFPRQWFISEDDEHLVQFQADRLIVNWRKGGTNRPYPRYSEVRRRFAEALDAFQNFIRDDVGGTFAPNQCEVTYLNQIPLGNPSEWGHPGRWVYLWTDEDGLESVQVVTHRLLKRPDGEPFARLVTSMEGGVANGAPALLLNLSARGRPETRDPEGVLDFLDSARAEIVTRFASIATNTANQAWGRTQ